MAPVERFTLAPARATDEVHQQDRRCQEQAERPERIHGRQPSTVHRRKDAPGSKIARHVSSRRRADLSVEFTPSDVQADEEGDRV